MLVLLGAGGEADEGTSWPPPLLRAGLLVASRCLQFLSCTYTRGRAGACQEYSSQGPPLLPAPSGVRGSCVVITGTFFSFLLTTGTHVLLYAKYLLVLYALCESPEPSPRCSH